MDSPYAPGFGARPAVVVGRERQTAKASATLTRVANGATSAPSVLVLTGARGLGKTVMLTIIADLARERSFVTAEVALDSVSDNVQLLAARVAEALSRLDQRTLGGAWERTMERLARLSIEVNAGVVKVRREGQRVAPAAERRDLLAGLLVDTARAAHDQGRAGLAVLIDELQEAPHDDLVIIANSLQDALRSGAPVAVFAAGLPETPEKVMEAASFTERFDFRALDWLRADDAERALLEPALGVGVHWEPAAAALVTRAAGGSPYLIQRIGDETWTLAAPREGDTIDVASATAALEEVNDSLGSGMFRGRWAKATPVEKALLVAVAQVLDADGVAHTSDLTALTGRSTPQWSTARHGLINKGLLDPVARGQLRFTMPGFSGFVLELVDAPHLGPAGVRQLADAGQLPVERPQIEA